MKKFVLIGICIMMFLSGCSSSNENNDTNNIIGTQVGQADTINVKDDRDLTLSMRSATTLNPLLNKDASVDTVLRLLFEPLVSISYDQKIQPSIAESWYYSEEGTALTINIKKNLKWHNGSDITAFDVVYSINVLKDADENAVYKECVERIISVDIIDTYSAIIRFSEAYVGNIYSLSFPIIPRSHYDGNSGKSIDFEPVGSGGYIFDSHVVAKEFILKSVENSFNEKPKIEKIVVKITNSNDTDLYSFSQKMIDCLLIDKVISGKSAFDQDSNKFSYINDYYDFLGFNFSNDILNRINIRKAIAHAIPTDSIIEGAYLSSAVKANNPLNPESWLNEQNKEDLYAYNLSLAKEYLELEGFLLQDGEKVRSKTNDNGEKVLELSILVNAENSQGIQTAWKIADELNGLGFSVTVESVDFNEYIQRLKLGEFDMFVGGWAVSVVPEFGNMFESTSIDNYINYKNEKMDELINNYRLSLSETAMKDNMSEILTKLNEDLPYISIAFGKSVLYTDRRISGANPLQFDALNDIENWTIE